MIASRYPSRRYWRRCANHFGHVCRRLLGALFAGFYISSGPCGSWKFCGRHDKAGHTCLYQATEFLRHYSLLWRLPSLQTLLSKLKMCLIPLLGVEHELQPIYGVSRAAQVILHGPHVVRGHGVPTSPLYARPQSQPAQPGSTAPPCRARPTSRAGSRR